MTPRSILQPLIVSAILLAASSPVYAASQTVTLQPVADSYVSSGVPNDNYGPQENLYLMLGSNANRSRLLLRFDLSSIPTNAVVSSSTLALALSSANGPTTIDTWTERITEPWAEETVTWNLQPATTAPSDLIRITRVAGEPKTWDMLAYASTWIQDQSQNHGVLIRSRDTGSSGFTYGFGSRENTAPVLLPSLTVTYDIPVDTTPPVISNLNVGSITLASAIVTFTTNEEATSTIEFGLTEAYGRQIMNELHLTSHTFGLVPLAPNSTYHYRVRTRDRAGNETVSADGAFTTPAETGNTTIPAGRLVKLTDDGNATTQVDSAVYYVGSDGKRHAFPNSRIYNSWYPDFSTVTTITVSDMAALPLGANVTYRPGVRMVKFQTLPKVYAMDRGGVLRWVASEAAAMNLYGSDWNTRIDDVNDAFFANYTFGADISSDNDFNPTSATNSTQTIDQDQGR